MKATKTKSLDEIKNIIPPVRDVNAQQKEKLSKLDKLAVKITDKIGTMGFFICIFVWTALWLGWNILAPVKYQFDPGMAFVLWLFLSNMIQIFLMPLLMIGQNLQSKHAEARAEADFEINTKAELEIETVLMHLQEQNTVLQEQNENILKILNTLNDKK